MADISIDKLLDADGPVAIIIKQPLAPIDDDDRVIFPPTYPLNKWNGRVHTIRDGDYRVTVELPSGSKGDKDESKENQQAGYQIDRFPDGSNVCVIDSPQSQSNRIEPKFKSIEGGKLVPQVEIRVGSETVNLLDVGHRAGDAVVRMSSLAADIHEAFTAAKARNFFKLAMIAPTSLVFGVWDSRSTQVKQQRAFKAEIRATNVLELSRSAQYTPAAPYVDAGALGEDAETGKGEESNLSQEGMLHALSTQTVGGVALQTGKSTLTRTVTVNLEAIRTLRGLVPPNEANSSQDAAPDGSGTPVDGTTALQRYILGLALVAAFSEPDLNLREGCNLRLKTDASGSAKLIHRAKVDETCPITITEAVAFALSAKSEFFRLAGVTEETINRGDAVFEKLVAEKFLSLSKNERDKIRKLGPITKATLDRYEAQGKDPFKPATDELKKIKESLGRRPRGRRAAPVKNLEAFNGVAEILSSLSNETSLPDGGAELATSLAEVARSHENSHDALKSIEEQIKAFKRAMKAGTSTDSTDANVKEPTE